MELKKVDISAIGSEVRFKLWVFCWDTFEQKDRCYCFKWHEGTVIFMCGGWLGEPQAVGEAETQEQAQKIAEQWLEEWLRKCGAL